MEYWSIKNVDRDSVQYPYYEEFSFPSLSAFYWIFIEKSGHYLESSLNVSYLTLPGSIFFRIVLSERNRWTYLLDFQFYTCLRGRDHEGGIGHNTTGHSTTQHSTLKFSTAAHNTTQHKAKHHSKTRNKTTQHTKITTQRDQTRLRTTQQHAWQVSNK